MDFNNILGFIGLALGGIGVIGGLFAGQDRNEALDNMAASRNRANEIEKRKQALSSRRQALQTVREARIKRATAISRATTQGALGSVRGAFGSLQSQAGGNFLFQNQFASFTSQQNTFLQNASIFGTAATKAGTDQALFGSIGKIGGSIFSNRNQIASLFP